MEEEKEEAELTLGQPSQDEKPVISFHINCSNTQSSLSWCMDFVETALKGGREESQEGEPKIGTGLVARPAPRFPRQVKVVQVCLGDLGGPSQSNHQSNLGRGK